MKGEGVLVVDHRLWGCPKPGGSPSKPVRTPRLTGRPLLRRGWGEARGAEVGVGLGKKGKESRHRKVTHAGRSIPGSG